MTENSGPAGTTYMLAEYAAEIIIAHASYMLVDVVAGVYDDKEDGKGQTGLQEQYLTSLTS
jgi:hypothetical protein